MSEQQASVIENNFGGISECIAQITTCYERHDAAEQVHFSTQKQMDAQMANVDAMYHILSFRAPATVQEACVYAAVLAGWILNSTIDDEGEGRERIDRMLRNLVAGLKQLSGDEFALPNWTTGGSDTDGADD